MSTIDSPGVIFLSLIFLSDVHSSVDHNLKERQIYVRQNACLRHDNNVECNRVEYDRITHG